MTQSTPRQTPTPARVPFSQVLAQGATTVAAGAQTALSKLPGSPIQAAAVRGSPSVTMPIAGIGIGAQTTAAQGPAPTSVGGIPISAGVGVGGIAPLGVGGLGAGVGTVGATATGSSSDPNGSIDQSMQQMEAENLYYLQIQEQVDAENRMFTTLSNVLKTKHDSDKAAIQNIHS
jgi:hypothetical protein